MIWREGFQSGALGAAASAVWFLLVDLLNGRPLHTPAALGAEIVQAGYADGPSDGLVLMAAAYTVFHATIFILAGCVVAAFVAAFDRSSASIVPGILVLVLLIGFGYHLLVITLLSPALETFGGWTVVGGNLAATASMVAYFWLRHPRLHSLPPPGL